jgi:carboxymethylenebutenolidase
VSAYLCLPAGAGPWPAVVVLHGAEGSKLNPGYRLIAQGLADAGFAALQVDYFSQTPGSGAFGVPPASDYEKDAPIWLREIGDGVNYLQTRPEIDPQRIGLNGYSLGAFMALDAAMLDPRVKAVAEFYGGVIPGLARNLDQMPPVLILHGDADSIVPVGYAYTLKALLSAHGRPYEIQIYPGAQHGFNFVPGADAQDAYARMGDFFEKWLAAPSGGR